MLISVLNYKAKEIQKLVLCPFLTFAYFGGPENREWSVMPYVYKKRTKTGWDKDRLVTYI